MILSSDRTSFGLLVACIPRLPAGNIPPRDPKIHGQARPRPNPPASREEGQQPGRWERGERKGQGQEASLDKLVSSLVL